MILKKALGPQIKLDAYFDDDVLCIVSKLKQIAAEANKTEPSAYYIDDSVRCIIECNDLKELEQCTDKILRIAQGHIKSLEANLDTGDPNITIHASLPHAFSGTSSHVPLFGEIQIRLCEKSEE